MSQRMQQGMPMVVMDEDAQRVKDKNAQEYNISAARAVAEMQQPGNAGSRAASRRWTPAAGPTPRVARRRTAGIVVRAVG